ncbi:hypothetical protein [Embleya scabrispora]|nr:hypothetical protein [Embleya scabrispora]MYS82741.1 hypothetical protein [Streptomyces sp. SID5474]
MDEAVWPAVLGPSHPESKLPRHPADRPRRPFAQSPSTDDNAQGAPPV